MPACSTQPGAHGCLGPAQPPRATPGNQMTNLIGMNGYGSVQFK